VVPAVCFDDARGLTQVERQYVPLHGRTVMRWNAIALTVVGAASAASAQGMEIGVKGGLSVAEFSGGDNGHNGLKSLRKALNSGDFFRVRMGVGRPHGSTEVHDHVLKGFSAAERKELPFLVVEAADAVESLISKGLEPTQAAFNR
jgi:hypothetical protein